MKREKADLGNGMSCWGGVFLLAIILCVSPIAAYGKVMPLPEERRSFAYEAEPYLLVASDPVDARPVGVAYYRETPGIVYAAVGLPNFPSPVDVFAAVEISTDPGVVYMLSSDMSFHAFPSAEVEQALSTGMAGDIPAWKKEITGTFVEYFELDILKSELPLGTYRLSLVVTPSDDHQRYFLWEATSELLNLVRSSASLKNFESCDDYLNGLKERTVREMEERINTLIEAAREGQWGCQWEVMFFSAPTPTPPPPVTGEASQYSTTNVQVAGVDEADFVKNDGGHIYVLADGRFQILDAWPPQESRVISSVEIEGEPKKLFVTNGKALIYSSLGPVGGADYYDSAWLWSSMPFQGQPECTYGYDCDFTGDGKELKITVFDISDLSKPEIERELWLGGSYINSRRIGTSVHTVALSPVPSFPGVSYYPDIDWVKCSYYDDQARQEMVTALEALKEKNRLAIETATVTDVLPSVKDTRHVNGTAFTEERLLTECTDYYESGFPEGQSFLTLLSLGIDDPESLHSKTILGNPGAVYASPDSLYIATRNRDYYPTAGSSSMPYPETTIIHKFAIGSELPFSTYVGSGMVKGIALNQFSMDEFNGYFRIATTSRALVPMHSTVSVLREEGRELVTVGQADNIAPSEDIRSTLFSGNKGFVVTFRQTDPLFVLDLSEPALPRVAGELKIPGFSTYMQLMDGDHLLTIGYDADEKTGFFQGIMLQIFDVEELAVPQLLHKEVIGTRGTTSDAATDHLAFNYFAPKGLLAIPATICEGGGGSQYGTTLTFSGLLVYDVSISGGFSEKGRVSHVDTAENWICGNWWTTPNSLVKRSIFMDDYVYSLSLDTIKVNHIDDLSKDIAVIDLTEE